jgi:translation elongation factor EF-4
MGNLISLKDGTLATVLSGEDLLDLIETHMGQEMKEAVVEWMNEIDLQHADDEECIHELNELISEDHAHYKEVLGKIEEESNKLTDLIVAKELDRRAISNTAGAISMLVNKEVCRC